MTANPAPAKMLGWLPQVGRLSATVLPGASRRITSAPSFNAPVPPRLCAVTIRAPSLATSASPNTSRLAASRSAGNPSGTR